MPNDYPLQLTFNNLFRTESDAIFRFCLIRVSDREQALDIIQETFLRLWRKLQDGTKMENARAFLFTVSHNLIIDWYRKKKAVRFNTNDEDGEEESEPVDEGTAGRELEMSAEGRYLIGSIGRLSLSYYRAVYLRYVEGLRPPEIGKILGISANAVAVRVNRGLHELRKLTGYESKA